MGANIDMLSVGKQEQADDARVVHYVGDFRPPAQIVSLPTMQELADRLVQGGVEIDDERACATVVQQLNYQQLNCYLNELRKVKAQLCVSHIRNAYLLDRATQAIFLAYVAHFELAFRARLVDALAYHFGSFAHLRTDVFCNRSAQRSILFSLLDEQKRQQRTGNVRILQELERYGQLTIWSASELMTLGVLSQAYRSMSSAAARTNIASFFGTTPHVLESWLFALTFVRNRCAHQDIMYGYRTIRPPQETRELARCDCRTLFGHFAILACLFGADMAEMQSAMTRELCRTLGHFDGSLAKPLGFMTSRGAAGLPGWMCVLNGCARSADQYMDIAQPNRIAKRATTIPRCVAASTTLAQTSTQLAA